MQWEHMASAQQATGVQRWLLMRLFCYVLSLVGDQDALLYADDLFCIAGTKQFVSRAVGVDA